MTGARLSKYNTTACKTLPLISQDGRTGELSWQNHHVHARGTSAQTLPSAQREKAEVFCSKGQDISDVAFFKGKKFKTWVE